MSIILELDSPEKSLGIYTFKISNLPADKTQTVLIWLSNKNHTCLFKKVFKLADIANGVNLHYLMLDPGPYSFNLNLTSIRDKNKYSINFQINSTGWLGKQIKESLIKNSTELIFIGPCDSSYYPYKDKNLVPWFDKDDYMEYINYQLVNNKISSKEALMLENFVNDGYMMIEGAYSEDLINRVNYDIDDAIEKKYSGYEYGSSNRIEHLHLYYDNIKELFLSKIQKKFVELIFGTKALSCQTLVFIFGSQQDPHQDSIHLTPFPAGFLCGVWISLQDIENNSGELIIYPGSHREKILRMCDFNCGKVANGDWSEFGTKIVPEWSYLAKKYKSVAYKPKKGTLLIWHENLLHGGSLRLNKELERRSLVIHYFAENTIGYYDSTGYPAEVTRI